VKSRFIILDNDNTEDNRVPDYLT